MGLESCQDLTFNSFVCVCEQGSSTVPTYDLKKKEKGKGFNQNIFTENLWISNLNMQDTLGIQLLKRL